MMKYDCPYLEDKTFLKLFNQEKYKEQFVRITILDFYTEQPVAKIEGKATGGSINLNGASAMRRTMSCSLLVDPRGIDVEGYEAPQKYNNIGEVKNIISMNKKIKVETGFYNTLGMLGYYPDYSLIWFPLGIYVIKAASVSQNSSGVNISLTLNDKTALVNGDMGGTIPAATIFSENELYNPSGTTREVEKILIKDIIKYIMVEFAGEKTENIIIKDIPDTIVKVVKWGGKDTLYFNETKKIFSLEKQAGWKEYQYGSIIGYMNEPFVYPGTLECNAGETASSVLDKIKNTLGNFEWFYDVRGRFIFQEIKNFINNSPTSNWTNLKEEYFLSISNYAKEEYVFDNKEIITAISNSPQFANIKNDFVVWGNVKTTAGANKPIRYHLTFDQKPIPQSEGRFGFVYKNARGLQQFQPLINEQNYFSQLPDNKIELEKNVYYSFIDVLPDFENLTKFLLPSGGYEFAKEWTWTKIHHCQSFECDEGDILYVFWDDAKRYKNDGDEPTIAFGYSSLGGDDWAKEGNWIRKLSTNKKKIFKLIITKSGTYRPTFYSGHDFAQSVEVSATIKNFHIIKIPKEESEKFPLERKILAWDDSIQDFRVFSEWKLGQFYSDEWRTELYFQGIENNIKSFFNNYYAAELNSEWPKIYDIAKSPDNNFSYQTYTGNGQYTGLGTIDFKYTDDIIMKYSGGYYDNIAPESYEYFLDFIEGNEGLEQNLSQFNVQNIGRRSKIVTENNVTCIFPTEIPNYIIIEADGDVADEVMLCKQKGQPYIQVPSDIFKNISMGTVQNSAFDRVKELLYAHTNYNETVSLTTIPIYHLEPNSRIRIEDNNTGVYGEYMIKSISLPLLYNGTSNISCIKNLQKTY